MIFDVNGTKFVLHVHHERVEGRWETRVRLHDGDCQHQDEEKPCIAPAYSGFSFCSPKDIFSRAVGRRVALTRALESLPRPLRGYLWRAYNLQSPPK